MRVHTVQYVCCLVYLIQLFIYFFFSNTVFASADAAYVLAYSIIMLTTDLHNSQVSTILLHHCKLFRNFSIVLLQFRFPALNVAHACNIVVVQMMSKKIFFFFVGEKENNQRTVHYDE